ncbi:MAG: GTP 3',8-cyclase MoaA [Anaerolineaceae bacterium]|nr:GTP 3',8-cyclase MoaA [Anaerolineaceae bacterium]
MAEAIRDTFDRPLRDLRISVTDRCNFRCAYCMPAEIFGEHYRFLPKAEILTFEEITRLTKIIVRLGAVKLRITGGEPLVREQLESLIAMLRPIDGVDDLTLTTNGYLLPQKAQILKDAGLNRITISLDSLDDTVFRKMNGNRSSVQKVLDGITAAEKAGLQPIKINCVVQRGVNDHTIVDLARWSKDKGYILRFIEYMDVGNKNGWRMDEVVPAQEIIERIDAVMPLEQTKRNYQSEVALRYKYQDGAGEIGLIASVTKPFCGACSRMRLSPEGSIYTCLFASQGTDLRAPLRDGASDDEIEQIIRSTWGSRIDRYSELRFDQTDEEREQKVEMYHIGG